MKKVVKKMIATACAVVAVASFSACGQKEIINAYDIAVKNGFKGTQAEWLASLNGTDGKDGENGNDLDIQDVYKAAQDNGFQGSFLDFLKEYLSVDHVENNDTETIAKNVSSVMSVCCAFTATTTYRQQGGFYAIDDRDGAKIYADAVERSLVELIGKFQEFLRRRIIEFPRKGDVLWRGTRKNRHASNREQNGISDDSIQFHACMLTYTPPPVKSAASEAETTARRRRDPLPG